MSNPTSFNFKLSRAGRIRLVIGVAAICLAWMEYITPSTSSKWDWLKRLLSQSLGDAGFVILLVCIGLLFIAWALAEAVFSKGDSK